VGKPVFLLQTYHVGPEKIALHLKRYHDVTASKPGVWRSLKRLDMKRLPSSQRYTTHKQRWKSYEMQRPDHHLQIDLRIRAPIKGKDGRLRKHYQFTAVGQGRRLHRT
jgi:hypothetical protein